MPKRTNTHPYGEREIINVCDIKGGENARKKNRTEQEGSCVVEGLEL